MRTHADVPALPDAGLPASAVVAKVASRPHTNFDAVRRACQVIRRLLCES